MKLYGVPKSRSSRVEWLLQEVGAQYEFVQLDFNKGDLKAPPHLARHMHGLVPAFEDGPLHMIESAAICLHVADKVGKLAPAPGTNERAKYYQFITYAVSTLDDNLIPMLFHSVILPPEHRKPEIVQKARAVWDVAGRFLTKELGAGPFLLGAEFSAADVVVGYDLGIAKGLGLLADLPALDAYAGRLMSRPAFAKAHRL